MCRIFASFFFTQHKLVICVIQFQPNFGRRLVVSHLTDKRLYLGPIFNEHRFKRIVVPLGAKIETDVVLNVYVFASNSYKKPLLYYYIALSRI